MTEAIVFQNVDMACRKLIYISIISGEESDKESPTGSRTVNRVTRYDCEQKNWISVPSMQLARRWAASIVIDNKIYVIGKLKSKGSVSHHFRLV